MEAIAIFCAVAAEILLEKAEGGKLVAKCDSDGDILLTLLGDKGEEVGAMMVPRRGYIGIHRGILGILADRISTGDAKISMDVYAAFAKVINTTTKHTVALKPRARH